LHWIAGNTPKAARFNCSCCGGTVYYPQPNRKRTAAEEQPQPFCPYPHCPYCGADMEQPAQRTGETISIKPSAAMRRIIARYVAEE
jgi:hypothetical protein